MVYLEYIHRSRIIASQFETSANVAVGSRGREVHLNSLPLFNLLLFHERRLTAIKRYSRPAAFLKGFPGFLRPLRISNQSYFAIYGAPGHSSAGSIYEEDARAESRVVRFLSALCSHGRTKEVKKNRRVFLRWKFWRAAPLSLLFVTVRRQSR